VIRDAVFDALRAGISTSDLGGQASTTGFTDSVIERVRAALESAP
jgi:isocitrate/isopropylmalate dehydrogenase